MRSARHRVTMAGMSFLRGAIKAGIAAKAIQIARREAAKPENQRRAKELMGKLADRRRGNPPHGQVPGHPSA